MFGELVVGHGDRVANRFVEVPYKGTEVPGELSWGYWDDVVGELKVLGDLTCEEGFVLVFSAKGDGEAGWFVPELFEFGGDGRRIKTTRKEDG